MNQVNQLKEKVLAGEQIDKKDALSLSALPLLHLSSAANEIRAHFCQNTFDLCSIVNGKSGNCSEDCIYCAQSIHCQSEAPESSILCSSEQLVQQAKAYWKQGALRFSIVTSGKRLSTEEIDQVSNATRQIKRETSLSICCSFGLLDTADYQKLKAAGVSRIHCNLESSKSFFPHLCTTHTWEEKVSTLKAAKAVGLDVCSGGIVGVGESMEDRIDMALSLRQLDINSVPLNLLHPIAGTPCEHRPILSAEEFMRTIAIFRFLLPDGFIRLAGGRGLLEDFGEACFLGGANAAISGNMLTTLGHSVSADLALLRKLNYEVRFPNA